MCTWEMALFAITAVIVLVTSVPFLQVFSPLVPQVHEWVVNVPAVAGVRGVVLGVALGVIATGLRLLTELRSDPREAPPASLTMSKFSRMPSAMQAAMPWPAVKPVWKCSPPVLRISDPQGQDRIPAGRSPKP